MRKTVNDFVARETQKMNKVCKIVFPVARYETCFGCGKMVKLEPIYEMAEPEFGAKFYGCKTCFKNKADFIGYLDEMGKINRTAVLFALCPDIIDPRDWAIQTKYLSETMVNRMSDKELRDEVAYCRKRFNLTEKSLTNREFYFA